VSANNEPVEAAPPRIPHATLRYTTLRLALFVAALAVMWGIAKLAGMDLSTDTNRLILLAVAILLSSSISFFALSRSQRMSRKLQDAQSFEDEEEDA
jgi:hypothetical protein